MTCIVAALLLTGCFSDPPASGDSGDSSTGPDATSSSSTDARGSSTSSGETGGSTGGSSSTGYGSSSTSFEVSSSETTDGETEPSFCMQPENVGALLCTDFDSPSPDDWVQGTAFGYTRTVERAPTPFSAPRFMRISRNDQVPKADPVEALFEGDDIDLGQSLGVELDLVFRLPPEADQMCDNRDLRLFSFEYVSPSAGQPIVRVVGAVSENELLLTNTDETGTTTVLGSFNDVHGPVMGGWRTLRVRLVADSSVGATTLEVIGSRGDADVSIDEFDPVDDSIDVTVGPSFEPGLQPPDGCNYDVDNIVLRAIPLE